MSTVKISELALISQLNANTSNTLFVAVDIPSGVTGKFTGHTLAQGLYSNEILNVGLNQSFLPNTIAQFSLAGASYIQTNLINLDDGGTADIVVTANARSGGTDSAYFIDVGFANANVTPGLEFNNLGTSLNPLDGYIYVQGNGVGNAPARGGNLIVGATSTNTEIKFIAGGYNSQNIVAKFTGDGFKMVNGHPIYFTDGTTQNTAANPIAFSQASFDKANNALANTTGTFAGSLTITNSINANTANIGNLSISNNAIYSSLTSADIIIGQSIATANLIINRTTNMTKDLAITGNITVQGTYIDFNNSTFNPNTAFIQITGSDNNKFVAPSNSSYMLHVTGKANTPTRIAVDSFGTGTYPVVFGRMGRGSAATPLASANNDILLRIAGNGYTGTQFTGTGPSRIDFVAAENFSDATKGTRVEFWNTPTGSNTIQRIASFNADSASFTGVVNPQKGFIYTPTQYPGAQTAITIDFANNSVIRANTSTGCTVSFVNYTLGKEVVLWLTNTAGTNQTFTHGVNALNSTVNSTTYNIPGTSTIMARYFSFGNDLANTFVAVVHQ
jgi:hypothetical protein